MICSYVYFWLYINISIENLAVKLSDPDAPDLAKTSSDPGQPQRTGQRLLPGPLAPACQASCPVRPFARVTCQASCTVLGVQRTFPDTKNQ